ncbi:MAG: methanethiol S-methyltransferase [Planctomycetota bacterium]|jgi:protein-S-isoprenylcysteine O-methyltransferase Ste14
MGRSLVFLYGMAIYLLFIATFLYAIGFVGNLVVPKSIDSGAVGGTVPSVIVNVLLLGLFAVQHSIMARPWFKAHWTKICPKPAERSTFVLATCVVLGLIFWQWRPMTATVWLVEHPVAVGVLWGGFALGFVIVLLSTVLIDHFDLFGVRQVLMYLEKERYTHVPFTERSLYRLVRHPLMLGFIIAFWCTPHMTAGHLLFAIVTTAYMLVAIRIEERDLVRFLGDDYLDYRQRTAMILPIPKRVPASDRAPIEV